MTSAETDRLIRQLIGGDAYAAGVLLLGAETSDDPVVLVAAALIEPQRPVLLHRAAALARSTRDRQLVAIAAAYLAGDDDRVDALARDHLVDHPDHLLVAWIAGGAGDSTRSRRPQPIAQPTHHQEQP